MIVLSKLEHHLRRISCARFRAATRDAILDANEGDYQPLKYLFSLARFPVEPEEFLLGADYLNLKGQVYPKVLEAFIELNSGKYIEGILVGSIGSAKTTLAIWSTAYQLYLISCLKSPQKIFGLDTSSEIVVIFQSLNTSLAKAVDYARFKRLVQQSKYFTTHFMFDKRILSELRFPHNIIVKPISGADTGAIGQNTIGGIIDELNYMVIIEKSKSSIDGGTYNQAVALYNSIARRRKSRFMSGGFMPGLLCLVSSKRYPGEFTDKKLLEAKEDPTIFVYDKRVWDIKPEGTYTMGWMDVYIGSLSQKAYIIKDPDDPKYLEPEYIVQVPLEYRAEFEDDIIGALRDIAGVGTLARYPFMLNVEKVSRCFGVVSNVFSTEVTELAPGTLSILLKTLKDKSIPRWVHIDLGVTNDACGLAIGHVPGFKSMVRVVGKLTEIELLPIIRFDGLLRITPPRGDEIQFHKVREILYLLRDKGLNIKWVTFDSYQSVDSIQLLRQKGFVTGMQSVDRTDTAYVMTKSAFYDGRIEAPTHERCLLEFLSLEKDNKTGKVDHPPNFSKDVSDGVSGVVYGLSTRREVWAMYGVPIRSDFADSKSSVPVD